MSNCVFGLIIDFWWDGYAYIVRCKLKLNNLNKKYQQEVSDFYM